jgi:hypothetical protein
MSLHEIVLPETEPPTEWVRGRALQKIPGDAACAAVQGQLAIALIGWAARGLHGRVAIGWRFRVAPPDKIVRPLVPEIAYLSYAALGPAAADEDVAAPLGSPTVAVVIVTPHDLRADIDDRVATYLEAESAAVLVVDPHGETIAVHDDDGVRVLLDGDVLVHGALPGFTLDVKAFFARAKRGRQ